MTQSVADPAAEARAREAVSDVVESAHRDVARTQTDFLGRMGQALCSYEGIFDDYPDGDLPDVVREEAEDHMVGLAGLALAQLVMLRCPSNPLSAFAATEQNIGLVAEIERLRKAMSRSNDDICQTLGKALGYPWFKDDPVNFPGATEDDGVCVGDHVAESIAAEVAAKLTAASDRFSNEADGLRASVGEAIREYGGCWVACTGCQESNEGVVSARDYPRSAIFQCQPGGGCGECGGIGVVWDNTDWTGYAEWALAQDRQEKSDRLALVEAVKGISDDYMTAERHHPGYVLIPLAKFEQLRAAEAILSTTPAGVMKEIGHAE